MGEKKESKLQHILKTSWESEQMPGWEDSLSVILETTRKDFQKESKDVTIKNMEAKPTAKDDLIFEEEFLL